MDSIKNFGIMASLRFWYYGFHTIFGIMDSIRIWHYEGLSYFLGSRFSLRNIVRSNGNIV